MSELRQNLATREWVIIAPERLKGRSLQSETNPFMETYPAYDPTCPFCPRNEERFENVEIDFAPHPDPKNKAESRWYVRSIENKFKIFEEYDSCPIKPTEFERDGIHAKFMGCGSHELVLESPIHNKTIATMSAPELEAVVGAYLSRFNALKQNPNNLLTIIFKNHGQRAGASQVHGHTQILSSRVVPNFLRFLIDEATRYFDTNGICVFCKILEHELKEGKRVVYENDRFAAYTPFAQSQPFEINIFPKVHDALFGDMDDREAAAFADCLRVTTRKLYLALSNPDYNLILRNPPYPLSGVPFYHWHLQIVPYTRLPGGFELGSRIMVNVMLPEECARILREADGQDNNTAGE